MKAIILPVCFLGLLSMALADDIRPQIKALNDSVEKTLEAKDIAAFTKVMKGAVTPDFKYVENAKIKPMTFDQMVGTMKQGLAMMTKVNTAKTSLLNVKISGDTATAMTSHLMTGTTSGADKKSHSFAFSGVSIDVYKKIGGAWKMASMSWKSQETKVDGHRLQNGM